LDSLLFFASTVLASPLQAMLTELHNLVG